MGSVVCGLGMSSHWNLNVRRKCVLFFFACFIFVFVFFPFFPSHVQFVRMGHFEGGGLNWVRGKWHRQKMYPPDLHKYRRPYANTHILPLELHFEYYLLHIDLHFWTTQPTAAQVRVSLVLDSCMMAHLLRTSYGRWMSPYTPFTRFRFSARSWTVNGFCVCWFFFFGFLLSLRWMRNDLRGAFFLFGFHVRRGWFSACLVATTASKLNGLMVSMEWFRIFYGFTLYYLLRTMCPVLSVCNTFWNSEQMESLSFWWDQHCVRLHSRHTFVINLNIVFHLYGRAFHSPLSLVHASDFGNCAVYGVYTRWMRTYKCCRLGFSDRTRETKWINTCESHYHLKCGILQRF